MEQILPELNRLGLGAGAVLIDLAKRQLAGIIAGDSKTLCGVKCELNCG